MVQNTFTEEVKNTKNDEKEASVNDVNLDSLWFIHGKAYDLQSFLKSHPGKDVALRHDSRSSAYTASLKSEGPSSDLSFFFLANKHHVGGAEVLLSSQGRDITSLFESYHPFSNLPRKLLASFKEVCYHPLLSVV